MMVLDLPCMTYFFKFVLSVSFALEGLKPCGYLAGMKDARAVCSPMNKMLSLLQGTAFICTV